MLQTKERPRIREAEDEPQDMREPVWTPDLDQNELTYHRLGRRGRPPGRHDVVYGTDKNDVTVVGAGPLLHAYGRDIQQAHARDPEGTYEALRERPAGWHHQPYVGYRPVYRNTQGQIAVEDGLERVQGLLKSAPPPLTEEHTDPLTSRQGDTFGGYRTHGPWGAQLATYDIRKMAYDETMNDLHDVESLGDAESGGNKNPDPYRLRPQGDNALLDRLRHGTEQANRLYGREVLKKYKPQPPSADGRHPGTNNPGGPPPPEGEPPDQGPGPKGPAPPPPEAPKGSAPPGVTRDPTMGVGPVVRRRLPSWRPWRRGEALSDSD